MDRGMRINNGVCAGAAMVAVLPKSLLLNTWCNSVQWQRPRGLPKHICCTAIDNGHSQTPYSFQVAQSSCQEVPVAGKGRNPGRLHFNLMINNIKQLRRGGLLCESKRLAEYKNTPTEM